jgi:hypothetical protein
MQKQEASQARLSQKRIAHLIVAVVKSWCVYETNHGLEPLGQEETGHPRSGQYLSRLLRLFFP